MIKGRVCFIARRDFRIFPRAYNEVETLIKKGYDVEIIAFDESRRLPAHECVFEKAKLTRVKPIFWLNLGALNVLNFFPAFFALFSEALKKPMDIYHCYDTVSLVVGFLLKFLSRKRLIYDAYEDWPDEIYNSPNFRRISSLAWAVTMIIEKSLSRFADYVLTIPTINEDLARKFKEINKNVLILPNFPKSTFAVSEGDQKTRAPEDEYKNYNAIFYIGALSKERGLLESIEAIDMIKNEIPNLKLLITESFYEDKKTKEDIIFRINKGKLTEYVEFVKPIPYDRLMAYLSVAKIGLMVYRPTSFFRRSKASLKPFIFMLSSTPLIISRFLPVSEIIKNEDCGIVVDVNPTEIAKAIMHLLRNPEEMRKMGERGRKATIKKYNWEIVEKDLIGIYDNTLQQR